MWYIIGAAIAYIVWAIWDGEKLIYPAGTWMELKQTNYVDFDYKEHPQYIRIQQHVKKERLKDGYSIWFEIFEPDGTIKQGKYMDFSKYKIVETDFARKLEHTYIERTGKMALKATKDAKEYREKALQAYLKGESNEKV